MSALRSPLKALTLWQPWATLVAQGLKEFETRSWGTYYLGELAIHAAKRPMGKAERGLLQDLGVPGLVCPLGAIVAVADLTGCERSEDWPRQGVTASDRETMVGDWSHGRFCWRLGDVRPVVVESVKGNQGIWHLERHDYNRVAIAMDSAGHRLDTRSSFVSFDWGPDEDGGYERRLGDGLYLQVIAAGRPGSCQWQVMDALGDLAVTGDADNVEQSKRRAERCATLLAKGSSGRWVLANGMSVAWAVTFVEGCTP